ncbi:MULTISPECIES: hypothetical protein [unclassified Ruegeria]|uniref:hypothetical protein n=1 Tax=unclassified Ruegeria TaxID=2625375 RepID=UPI001490D989|nr:MULTISPECIES: hypothetical protein [unclassified Ruegeria]NOD87899.1 hypothetical protein [Ruegeria sp. HKCCD4318]NOE14269.1 hypothetical protein [Ruegeria sp. HKCCD4318-2]NOG08374.1 hypothetical protein [Ruegeria sp. HKCCD4315]
MKDHFDGDTAEDRKARKLIDAERKAALFDAAMAEAKQIPQRLDQVKQLAAKVEELQRAVSRPVTVEARLKQPHVAKGTVQRIDPVLAVGSALTAEFCRYVGQKDVDQTLHELHPDERGKLRRKAARDLLTKSATNPATTTAIGWAADLVESDHLGWVSALETTSIFGAIVAAGGRPIPMGRNHSVSYAKRSPIDAGAIAQAFVQESGTFPVKQATFAGLTFSRKKMGVITVASNELYKVAVEDLRTILLEMIIDDTSQMLDAVILDPTLPAQANLRPGSPWFNEANRASAGTDLASIISDLSYLITAIDRPKKPLLIMDTGRELRLRTWRDNMGWVFGSEMDKGTIFGVPFVSSASVPTDQIYIIDADDFMHWINPAEVDMSQTATVVMANDSAPDPAMTAENAITEQGSIQVSDAIGTSPAPEHAAQVKSMFQTDSTALRCVTPTEWGMLHTGRAAWVSGVAW